MNQEFIERLDLKEYMDKFNSFLARKKPLFIEGDSKIAYRQLLELSKVLLKESKEVANLDDALIRLSKHFILHISEIYEFCKIISYFVYIKKTKLDGSIKEWLDKIVIPDEIYQISMYFNDKGELKEEIDERFKSLNVAFAIKKEAIDTILKRIVYSKNLAPYLVDTQIHYINENETLLLRGGFNHFIKGRVVARSSGGFFYIIPDSISKLKDEQEEILQKKELIIEEYTKKISTTFSKNLAFLKFINGAFDRLDSLIARVMMAKCYDYEFVLPNNSKEIVLKEFAHPALKNPKRVDISFDKKVLLITGVNAGGKSMLLKSIITASFLCKYLLPMSINAANSSIATFKEFDLIMEDPQNVKNDISTFAGRMLHFSKLFGKKNILIGIDEIELGTDFEEAAALYSRLVGTLIKDDVKVVITTHNKHLAVLLAKNEDVEMLAALYDEAKALPKYEFLKGTIGKSYAFETALRYGIPSNLVKEAKELYGEDKEGLNEAISKAINLESELKESLQECQRKEQKLQSLTKKIEDEHELWRNRQKESLSRLELEYYNAINELKKGINLKDTKEKQRAINRANELKKAILLPKENRPNLEFKVGDAVKYQNIKGTIISISKNEATVQTEGISLRVALKELRPTTIVKQNRAKNIKISVEKSGSNALVLDLHGLRSDEAIMLLDKFISDSLIAGFDEVIVKHGIGTGKLAWAVKNFLSTHPSVKEFYDAPPSQGGYGSKVVRL